MLDVARLRADLLAARKTPDKVVEVALKRAIGRIESAEAPRLDGYDPATTEVNRLELTETDLRAAIQAEIDESLAAAEMYVAGGQSEAAERLLAETAVLQRYLQ